MFNFGVKTRGEFRLTVVRNGVVRTRTKWQPNLITDYGMNSFCTSSGAGTWQAIAVGSGTTPPAFTDTQLASHLASTNAGTWAGAVSGNTVTFTAVGTFALGAVVGNVSELGVRSASTSPSNPMCTRALVLDGGGSPTAIPVQAEDQLIVTYRVIFTIDQSITSATITDPASSTVYTVRAKYGQLGTSPSKYGLSSGAMGNLESGAASPAIVGGTFNGPGVAPSGGSSQNVTTAGITNVGEPYVPGSFTVVGGVRYGTTASALDRDNVNILRVPGVVPGDYIDFEFSPPFRKPATYTATLRWRVSWARG